MNGFDEGISHVQFAANTYYYFLKRKDENIMAFKRILQWFQLTSELKVNYTKSFMYSSDQGQEQVDNRLESWDVSEVIFLSLTWELK